MKRQFITAALFLVLAAFAGWFEARRAVSAGSVSVTATVNAVCGDGVAEAGEQCDGSDLRGQSCASQSFSGGTLACNVDCTFNTSQCTIGGGGGGGGGGYFAPSFDPYDLNGDFLHNFKDLSILLYWFGKTGPEINRYDFSKDGKINFRDVSIFLYHWKDKYNF